MEGPTTHTFDPVPESLTVASVCSAFTLTSGQAKITLHGVELEVDLDAGTYAVSEESCVQLEYEGANALLLVDIGPPIIDLTVIRVPVGADPLSEVFGGSLFGQPVDADGAGAPSDLADILGSLFGQPVDPDGAAPTRERML